MKIFKIKFDSKDPTDRSISVKKDDDFGIAIQIDNQQSQGPSKLLYAGQEVEANKDLIEGYNVFLLKAIKDSKISVKDIDSQVIFTLNILAKDSDVVELGGTGGGGDSVWQYDGICTYSIPGVLSVDSCYQTIKSPGSMTFMPENGQASISVLQNTISLSSQHMCIEAPCDICIKGGQVRIYNGNGNETLNIGSSQWFGNVCKSTTIKGKSITICSNNSLNLNADSINMMYGYGWQVFNANPNDNCIVIGNCSKTLELDAGKLAFYVPNGNVDVNASNFNIAAYTTYFSDCTHEYSTYAIGTNGYCGTSFQYINYPVKGEINIVENGTIQHLKTKTLAIILSAVQCVFLGNEAEMEFDFNGNTTAAFNKLTAIFSA